MSLVKIEEIFKGYESESELLKSDEKSYAKYLLQRAAQIPDKWIPHEKRHESDNVFSISFKGYAQKIELHIKAFALDLYAFQGRESETVSTVIGTVYRFLSDVSEPSSIDVDTDFQDLITNYLLKLQEHVKNKVKNKTNEVIGKEITMQTARQDAFSLIRFVIFMKHFSNVHNWASNLDISTILPTKISNYFSKKELQIYKNELVSLLNDNATISIPWSTLYDIMKFVRALPPSHIKTAIIIMTETGLRVSEVRTLTVDCLEPVNESEKISVVKYFERLGKEAPIPLDYSSSYWLKYHVVKGKNGKLIEGTPILVGQTVKKAIDELIKITTELRIESGSNMLFLNRNSKGIAVRSSAALRLDRDKLVTKGMPFLQFHQLRATFATILYRLGVNIGMIEKYMNHMHSDVTNGYINSQRSESILLSNKVLEQKIGGINENQSFQKFAETYLSLIESAEFAGLSHSSQLRLYERLLKKHDIKLSSGDHGTCVLPADKGCPNGYEGVNPCHTEECKSFKPDTDESSEEFFILSLARAQSKEHELENFAKQHGSLHVNFEPIKRAKRSLNNILTQIRTH